MAGNSAFDSIRKKWREFDIEVPSWGFGRGGTRFGTYPEASDPKTGVERIKEAKRFFELTGKGKRVALHFPWDGENESEVIALGKALTGLGLEAGAVNANFFSMRDDTSLDARLRYGGLISPFDDIREACIGHIHECIEYMRLLKSDTLVLWLPDGTNSPGQMSLYEMSDRLDDAFARASKALESGERMLIEYKPFEPAFYATAVPDWGSALDFCRKAGANSGVLVDLGHHLQGCNVEQVVAFLIREGRLGGFHFNDSKYADDDLASGSLNPTGLFRIFAVLVEAERRGLMPMGDIAFMIDESHNIKDPMEEMVESLVNIETAYLKAMLIDWDALADARSIPDPVRADAIMRDAFLTDVRPMLYGFRENLGLHPDPLAAAIEERE